jgi:hypothetical protein
MGTVYRAFDLERREEVALKRLRLRADPEANRRRLLAFEREYQALAQLHHPSIVAAYDYGVDRLGAYYTMELLSGASLHERSERGGVDWKLLCSWLRDVASALATLHARRLVHRDVTSRNIHCSRGADQAKSRAKLIDFGALSNTERIATLVGTPPFLPPEAISGRPIDARSDLYALGATAYWALTGTHAYPAKHIAELETLWRVTPTALHTSEAAASIPGALSELVMSLLSLDPAGRPSGADQVIERLTAIAGLPVEDARSLGSSYLVRPGYVGRNAQLREARRRALQALRGRGSVLLAAGVPGSGRTRYLEECALEAKLLGMNVHKLGSEDAASAEQAAEAILDGARGSTSATLWVVEAIGAEAADELTSSLIERGLPEQRALVVIAKTGSISASAHLHATQVDLPPLNVLQARTLLASMFGVGAGLESLAATLHSLSRGNVRAIIELSRALIMSGTLRCNAGTWLFPERIHEAEIAELARIALGDEVARLDEARPDVQLAAFALALSPPRVLSLSALTAILPEMRGCSLDELAAELSPLGVVVQVRTGGAKPLLKLANQAWAKLLGRTVPDATACTLNARLADLALKRGMHQHAIFHYWRAGELDAATDLLLQFAAPVLAGVAENNLQFPVSSFFRAISACAAAAERNGRTQRERVILDSLCFLHDLTAEHVTKRDLRRVLDRLMHDCGLADYERLDPALPQRERVRMAIEAAAARYASAAPGGNDERALFEPEVALRLLARVVLGVCTVGVVAFDTEWFRMMPELGAFSELSPALFIADETKLASHEVIEGKYLRARERYIEIVRRLDAPDGAGLAGTGHHYTRLGLIHGIGFIESQMGMQGAVEHIAALANDPHLSVSAWHLQGTFHFMQGDTDQANACRERAELLNATVGVLVFYPGTSLIAELLACGLADDLIGLKRAADRAGALVLRHEGWQSVWAAAQIEYARVRGDLAGALALLDTVPLREMRASQMPGSEMTALAAARTLLAANRLDEAYEVASALASVSEATGMLPVPVGITLAMIEARRGEMSRAIARTEAMLRELERLGCRGLPLGRAHETRATLACLAGDHPQLKVSARACAQEYARGHNPALHALYQGLLTRARRAGLPIDLELSVAHNDTRATPEAVEAELNESACEHELAERALSHVVARSGARDGFLYLRDFRATGAVRRVASRGTPSALIDAHALSVLRTTTEEVTVSVADGDALANEALGYEHETLVLGRDEIAPAAIGVIVLVDSHRHGSPATLELMPALTRSCARRPFNGTCKHESTVLLEERDEQRSAFVKGAS